MTIKELSDSFKRGDISSVVVTETFIEKIKKNKLNAVVTLSEDLALTQAKISDERIRAGDNNRLLGIPGIIKDNIMVEGIGSTAGSVILKDYISSYDATVINNLKKDGSIILGKSNMDEFAMGSSTEMSIFGATKNPYDSSRVAGGSSGGSAVAVAADLSMFALGSETGGSVRQPASFCNVVGLKPTYGSVSRYGLMSMASSLDQIGVLAKSVEDVEDVFSIISGKDAKDSTSSNYTFIKKEEAISGLKIGIPKEYFTEGIDKKIETRIRETIDKISDLGAEIREVSLPHTNYAIPVYYIIMSSEVSSNMSRYDGLRYGINNESKDIIDSYFKNRGVGFGPEVKRRIMLGTYCLSSGYNDAYYKKALKVKSLIKSDFTNTFKDVDIIITPVSPTLPFKMGDRVDDPLSMYLSDIFTVTANLAEIPAISVPCGMIDNLPVGIQIIGQPFQENRIIQAAKNIEKIWKQ